MPTVSDKAVAAHLETRFSKFEKTDRRIAREVEAQKNTTTGILKVGRSLFPGCDQLLRNVLAAIEAARTAHEAHSVPFPPSRAVHIEFLTKHREAVTAAIGQFDIALGRFIDSYDKLVETGIRNSNGLNTIDEYMPKDDIPLRFRITLQYDQLTDAEDWFKSPILSPDHQKELFTETQKNLADRLRGADNFIRDQLCALLANARENLHKTQTKDPANKLRFNTAWLPRLQSFVSIWPGLNISNDPNVTQMILDLTPITSLSLDALKNTKTAQDKAYQDIQSFIAKHDAWLNADTE